MSNLPSWAVGIVLAYTLCFSIVGAALCAALYSLSA